MYWAIVVIVLLIIGFILDREIYFYEGAHLGPRLQALLYNRWLPDPRQNPEADVGATEQTDTLAEADANNTPARHPAEADWA